MHVRPVTATDEAQWTVLYAGYREFYRLAPDPAVVARVWTWLLDDAHEVDGLVAEEDGALLGLAHHRRFARPSSGTSGLYLDDLFVRPDRRGAGTGRALIGAVSAIAEQEGRSVVRWITADSNAVARRLYDAVATATSWVTYDLVPAAAASGRPAVPDSGGRAAIRRAAASST